MFQPAAKACLSRGDKPNGDNKPRSAKAMSDKPPKLPPLGFAGFEASSAAAGRSRRNPRWALRPMHEPSEGEAVDAGRFVRVLR
jgi:hypothetical protein